MKAYKLEGTTALMFSAGEGGMVNGRRTPILNRHGVDHYLSQVLASHGFEAWLSMKEQLGQTYLVSGNVMWNNDLPWEEATVPLEVRFDTNPTLISRILRRSQGEMAEPINYEHKITEVMSTAAVIVSEAGLCGEYEEALARTFEEPDEMMRAPIVWNVSATLIKYIDCEMLANSKKYGVGGNKVVNMQYPDDSLRLRVDIEFATQVHQPPDKEYVTDWLEANNYEWDELELNSVERNDDDC